jgi:V/A-type H+-transporting ATPase subunit D
MREVTPTKSTALALSDERNQMRQGYEFLDEKRMLLAGEILRQLAIYQERSKAFSEDLAEAQEQLARAVERHGFEGLCVHPAAERAPSIPPFERTFFLGVSLLHLSVEPETAGPSYPPLNPSPEAEACRAAFQRLIAESMRLATLSGNLYRLAQEFRRTDRRTRAIENILLPELSQLLKWIEEHLEIIDQEEAIRVRSKNRSAGLCEREKQAIDDADSKMD